MAHEHPFAFETGAIDYADDCHALPARHARRPGALRRARRLRDRRAARRRRRSARKSVRQVQLAHRPRAARAASRRAPRDDPEHRGRHGHPRRPPRRRPSRASSLRREILVDHRPGAGIRYSPALLHDRRRDRPRASTRRARSSIRAPIKRPRVAPGERASEPHSPWLASHTVARRRPRSARPSKQRRSRCMTNAVT